MVAQPSDIHSFMDIIGQTTTKGFNSHSQATKNTSLESQSTKRISQAEFTHTIKEIWILEGFTCLSHPSLILNFKSDDSSTPNTVKVDLILFPTESNDPKSPLELIPPPVPTYGVQF